MSKKGEIELKIKSVEKEEILNMSYDDVAYIILKEKGKKMKIADLFSAVCENMDLAEKEYVDKIGDFFTLLATEKRFIQLDKGYWDLRENHQVKIELKEDDDTDDDIELEEDVEITEEESNDDFYDDPKESDDDDTDDDLKDLVIVDENMEETDI